MFAGFLYAYFPIVWLIYPETTQRTLEDMDVIFRTNPSVFVFANKDLTQRKRPQAFIEAEMARVEEKAQQMKQPQPQQQQQQTGGNKEGAVSAQYVERV